MEDEEEDREARRLAVLQAAACGDEMERIPAGACMLGSTPPAIMISHRPPPQTKLHCAICPVAVVTLHG
jgi:hypothetical protein